MDISSSLCFSSKTESKLCVRVTEKEKNIYKVSNNKKKRDHDQNSDQYKKVNDINNILTSPLLS